MIRVTTKENLQPLKDLARRARELEGRRNVPVTELLTPEFLSSCSRFASADEMFEASGFQIESAEDFKAIPDAEWNAFISSNTSCPNWETMLAEASGEWAKRQLGLE
ncbi:MAG TPA: hypothetical protein VHU83_20855 [Bryobacteraceae bacterium]|jgi:hypothetical protein|nr:hypothetical protein [Bryobacteraceae bacterium]